MTPETRKLLALRHLGEASLGEFVEWAVAMLESGADTEHLRMLASLGSAPSRADIDYYFGQVIAELGWEIPAPEDLLRQYAGDIARAILNDSITSVEACHQIYRVSRKLDFPPELQNWYVLYELFDLGSLIVLDRAAWEADIRREANRFLGLAA